MALPRVFGTLLTPTDLKVRYMFVAPQTLNWSQSNGVHLPRGPCLDTRFCRCTCMSWIRQRGRPQYHQQHSVCSTRRLADTPSCLVRHSAQALPMHTSCCHYPFAPTSKTLTRQPFVTTGDPLTAADCGVLVERLQRTQQCFSCAHGRPTMAPLADMPAIRRLIAGRRNSATGSITGSATSVSCDAELVRGTAHLHQVISENLLCPG